MFGNQIKAARKRKKLTQAQLAQLIGVATGTIQQYELEKRNPGYITLRMLSSVLDVSVAELIGDDPLGPQVKTSSTDESNFSTLKPEDELMAAYGEIKDKLTEDDIADIKKLMQLRAELHGGDK